MKRDRSDLRQSLAALPAALIAVLTLRSALRHLPTFLLLESKRKEAVPDPPVIEGRLVRFRLWLYDWFDKAERQRDAADERRFKERAIIFGGFHACQASLFCTWHVTASRHTPADLKDVYDYGAWATEAGMLSLMVELVDLDTGQPFAPAAFLSAALAASAALIGAGLPLRESPSRPESLTEPTAYLLSAAIELVSLAIELAIDDLIARELSAEIVALEGVFPANANDPRVFAEAFKVLSSPLWPRGTPSEWETSFLTLKKQMLEMNAGFDLWVTWFEHRIQGTPLDLKVERQWSYLSNEWREVDRSHLMDYYRTLAQGGAAHEPDSALLAAARREKEALEQRKWKRVLDRRDIVRANSGPLLWRADHWKAALRTVTHWRNWVPLALGTYGAVSFLRERLGLQLEASLVGGSLEIYSLLRDWLFAWTPSLGFALPRALKDLSFVYFYIGDALRWVLKNYFAPAGPRTLSFRRKVRRAVSLIWARVAWPWHLIGFYMGWVDPVRVYSGIDPEIYDLFARARGDKTEVRDTPDMQDYRTRVTNLVYARAIPFFLTYLAAFAVTTSGVLLGNVLLR